ncbi:hypothetical protein BDF20DRAFT_827316 [Mycotypha africana]|uniref:uncharacterized protein n=1 Tax=Mycotypha africana TaxID=64632 RepID=UPI002301374F|nr:uncharacterized protein BDF20DRAFT_827316 [Mycotypha africana]KAI8969272.1 hypothetical protein BDF20DRAFT_827316 [Mycotypha africana]
MTGSAKRSRLLPTWILRLVGISSIATVIIGFVVYYVKKFPPRRRIGKNDEGTESSQSRQNLSQQQEQKMTISLKNTILWNPSPDVTTPIYGFKENNLKLLAGLSYIYDIYIIVHVNSEEEKSNIDSLLKANLKQGSFDKRKILYCSEEEGKVHIVRHIEPFIHIEGGWEMDDGENIVKKLKPFIHKIVWLLPKNKLEASKDVQVGSNIEVSDSFIDTSIAHEITQQL